MPFLFITHLLLKCNAFRGNLEKKIKILSFQRTPGIRLSESARAMINQLVATARIMIRISILLCLITDYLLPIVRVRIHSLRRVNRNRSGQVNRHIPEEIFSQIILHARQKKTVLYIIQVAISRGSHKASVVTRRREIERSRFS